MHTWLVRTIPEAGKWDACCSGFALPVFQFNLSPMVLGSVFMLTSAFYALFSPLWGRVTDRMVGKETNNNNNKNLANR